MKLGPELVQQIRDKARELLTSEAVDCVIGYGRATDGVTARPLFVYEPEKVNDLIFDETCTHNLVGYLVNRKGKKTGIVVKPCDSRAINVLLNEGQISRDDVSIIGVVCDGVVETGWNRVGEAKQARCQYCHQHTPVVYDFLIGEPREESPPSAEDYAAVAEMEAKSPEEREAFWAEQFDRCCRCYACRQVCPGCYCTECFVDKLDPMWVGIRIAPEENRIWHTIRAYHLAGRCSGCNECERVCPVNIPLSLLNRKLAKDVEGLFGFQAGLDDKEMQPLGAFDKDEKLGIGE